MDELTEVELKRLEFAYMEQLTPELVRHLFEVKARQDAWMGGVFVRICATLYGDEGKTYRFRAPKDWWQAFRERWFPRLWLKRYPVLYRREELTARNVYPELALRLNNEPTRIVFQEERHVDGEKIEEE